MKLLNFLNFLFITLSISAHPIDELRYPLSEIPEYLREDANVVIRRSHTTFRISSSKRATYHVLEVFTILNENGKNYAEEVVFYDKLSRIVEFKGSVFNSKGELLRKLKSAEIHDQSAIQGYSLYEDNRIKWCDLSQGAYPYTVEFEYEIEFKFLFYIPSYSPLREEKISLQDGKFSIEYPSTWTEGPRFKLQNFPDAGQKVVSSEYTKMQWSLTNLRAAKHESFGPPWREMAATVFAAPTQFEFEDYKGIMNDWNGFGKWVWSLNAGRDELPPETKEKVRELTSGLSSVEEKTKVLYEYLQNKTRYVSIQVGIGGFQPFEAKLVDQTGYGDCKALSNYMVALLKEAGVKADYALIRAGGDVDRIEADFPSSQFNHAIAYVPNKEDTLWLECTSQTNPFGYLGTFTFDRQALAITDKGGQLVHTKDYPRDQNVQARKANIIIDETGNALAKILTTYKGLQYENGHLNFAINDHTKSQKDWVLKNTIVPSFDLIRFKLTDQKDKIPSAKVELELALNKVGTINGKHLFISPNLMNRSTINPEKNDSRKSIIERRYGYNDIDTINYRLPENFYPEFLPEAVNIHSQFGEYEANFAFDQGKMTYIRSIKIFKGKFPPSSYPEFCEFYKKINKADNIKLVFLNKT